MRCKIGKADECCPPLRHIKEAEHMYLKSI